MAESRQTPPPPAAARRDDATRRLAEALRENLKRRKAQARGRKAGASDAPSQGAEDESA